MMVICRKLKLFPIGDKEEINRVYEFIRNGQYAQYQALNLGMGLLTSSYLKCNRNIKDEEFKETQKSITNSNPIFNNIEYAKGVDTLSMVTQKIKQDFSIALKNGLAKGERFITNYKRSTPLMVRGRDLRLIGEENLYNTKEFDITIKFVNKISFSVILGNNLYKTLEIRHTLRKLLIGEYEICGSSIQIDGKNIMLNLSIKIPDNKIELNDNVSVGMSFGVDTPAICAINNSSEYLLIGNREDLLIQRTKIQSQLDNERRRLRTTQGGHGRVKKLKALERFKQKESNFVKTYNHFISNKIVQFALKNNAKNINVIELTKEKIYDNIVLRNWSYYQLYQFIEYKAKFHGIVLRKVNIDSAIEPSIELAKNISII